MKFLILCVFALVVSCLAGKLRKTPSRKTDLPSLDEFQPDDFGASDAWANDAWANDEWGDEEWPSEPYKKPEPYKVWDEPIVVEKKVPVYVPVPVEHVRTIVKHHPVYIKEKSSPSIFIRKITHYKHH